MKTEPFLPQDLEESADGNGEVDWYAKALRSLAAQLGVGNDFFYPLIDAAAIIESIKLSGPLHSKPPG